MATTDRKQPPTGIAGSDRERRAAERLAESLRGLGRSAGVEPVTVRISETGTITAHALLALAGGLFGLKWPLIGAAIVLLVSFSFYAERSLGMPLIGRLMPTRASQNVMSPPPGPAWADGIEVLLTAGYDLPSSYPFGEWLSRHLGGRLTSDRLLLWVGALPVFVAAMLGAAEVEGTWVGVIQLIGSAVLLGLIAAQVDRRMSGETEAGEEDLKACDNLLAALEDELDRDGGDPPIGVCLFGAESASAKGAAVFFAEYFGSLRPQHTVLINFVNGQPAGAVSRPGHRPRALLTAKEGDLATFRMSTELAEGCPVEPEPAILRITTAATVARRRGLRASSVVGGDEDAVELGLDLIENSYRDDADAS